MQKGEVCLKNCLIKLQLKIYTPVNLVAMKRFKKYELRCNLRNSG